MTSDSRDVVLATTSTTHLQQREEIEARRRADREAHTRRDVWALAPHSGRYVQASSLPPLTGSRALTGDSQKVIDPDVSGPTTSFVGDSMFMARGGAGHVQRREEAIVRPGRPSAVHPLCPRARSSL